MYNQILLIILATQLIIKKKKIIKMNMNIMKTTNNTDQMFLMALC
jgi:hypothetical protein